MLIVRIVGEESSTRVCTALADGLERLLPPHRLQDLRHNGLEESRHWRAVRRVAWAETLDTEGRRGHRADGGWMPDAKTDPSKGLRRRKLQKHDSLSGPTFSVKSQAHAMMNN